jgi:hypothetical protein
VAASIHVQPLVIKGESHSKSNVTKIGGGAALGAVIGAIAGGGKGAAIGTLAGGAAGTGAAAATGKKPATVDSEAILTFVTSTASSPTAPLPANSNESTPMSAPPAGSANSGSTNAGSTNAASPNSISPQTPSSQSGVNQDVPPPDSTSGTVDASNLFTLRDRRIIRECVNEHSSDLPAAATQRPELPSGAERQIRRGGVLSTEIQNAAQALPLACEDQLPKLPSDLERVVYSGRVLLIDSKGHVIDMFPLDQSQ